MLPSDRLRKFRPLRSSNARPYRLHGQYIAHKLTSVHRQHRAGSQRRGLDVLGPCMEQRGKSVEDLCSAPQDGCIILRRAGGKEIFIITQSNITRKEQEQAMSVQDDQPVLHCPRQVWPVNEAIWLDPSHVSGRYTARTHSAVILDDNKGARGAHVPTLGLLSRVHRDSRQS